MPQFTVTTPKFAARVSARSHAQIENAAREVGLTVLGIHRDGDEFIHQPGVPSRPTHSRRPTAFGAAFDALTENGGK